MDKAIAEAYAHGYLGKNIRGTGFDFDLYTHTGAGAYECGEESALLESLRRQARHSAYPSAVSGCCGAFQCPTILNNVETYLRGAAHHPGWRRGLRGTGYPEDGGTQVHLPDGSHRTVRVFMN